MPKFNFKRPFSYRPGIFKALFDLLNCPLIPVSEKSLNPFLKMIDLLSFAMLGSGTLGVLILFFQSSPL